MHQKYQVVLSLGTVSVAMGALLLTGCGSGSGTIQKQAGGGNGSITVGEGAPVEQTYGPLITRMVGTAQPPVLSNGTGVSITGVAGASFGSIAQERATSKIAYVTSIGQGLQYGTVSPGGAQTQITNDSMDKGVPAWSPDGTRIAFESNGQIMIMPADGSGTPTPLVQGFDPSWSPDGSTVLYVTSDLSSIAAISPGGGDSKTIIPSSGMNLTLEFGSPFLSPDGSQIVCSGRNLNSPYDIQVYVVPADNSSGPRPISTGGALKYRVAWSPDGTRIAYATNDNQIYTVSLDGSDLKHIVALSHPVATLLNVAWSPDGKMLCYHDGLSAANPLPQIWKVASDGSGTPARVTTGDNPKWLPSWSPFLIENVSLLGAKGPLGTGAAGFLFGQTSNNVRSLLTFDTKDGTTESRAGARIAAVSPNNSGASFQLFTITVPAGMGRVAYIGFDNTTGDPGVAVVPSLPQGAVGALVMLDSITGKVSRVMPYAPDPGAAVTMPRVVRKGSELTVYGRFLAAFDAAGTNQAEKGAGVIRLDPNTGAILSLQ